MKRTTLIAIGAMIILLMIGMWVYLLIFGAPKQTSEIFTNLGISTNTGAVRVIDAQTAVPTSTPKVELPTNQSALEQLTQRVVAGFSFIANNPDQIVYMEKGTGHVYQIDTQKGTEVTVSTITIPGAASAVFSPDGTVFVVTTYTGYIAKSSFGIITNVTDTKLYSLPINATNIAFKDDATVLFTLEESGATVAYTYSRTKLSAVKLFSIPFENIKMYWGYTVSGMYAQTKPAATLLGYVYKVSATGILTPLPDTGYGLTILPGVTHTISSYITKGFYTSSVSGSASLKQPFAMFSEKCSFDSKNNDITWCAAPLTPVNSTYLENWYKGVAASEDYLWRTNVTAQSATLVGDFKRLSSTTIDAIHMQNNITGSVLIFENKNDDTLWMYKIQS